MAVETFGKLMEYLSVWFEKLMKMFAQIKVWLEKTSEKLEC